MKRTQIVTHIMPTEIDEYSDIIDKLTEASEYLEKSDWISIYATLNLSPELVNWEESELKQDFFIDRFNQIKQKCYWANEVIFEIIDDNSILGTTAQKRKAIKGEYDQFIFLDCDIAFHPTTLKYILECSYKCNDYYIVTPQTVKLWDSTWDCITHNHFLNKEYGYQKIHNPINSYEQKIEDVNMVKLDDVDINKKYSSFGLLCKNSKKIHHIVNFKFACGWFTLYSKSIVDLIGIPEWIGQYGPEDSYMMYMAEFYKIENWPINQYILSGIYISENYINRDEKYKNKVKSINIKNQFRQNADSIFIREVEKAKNSIQNYYNKN